MKLNFSIVALALIVQGALAQDADAVDSTVVRAKKPDSLKVKFYPRSIRFGTDLITLVKGQAQSNFSGWEVNGDVDCGKVYIAADLGSWGRSYQLPLNGNYDNQGTYWRFGADVNLLKKDPDRNMFFVGVRFAHAAYHESSLIILSYPYFGDIQKVYDNTNVTASWGELTAGLRVRVWKELWMGYTGRLKFAASVKGDTEIKSYDIPGYGVTAKGYTWGFNYQIFWRIPFMKEKKKAPTFPK